MFVGKRLPRQHGAGQKWQDRQTDQGLLHLLLLSKRLCDATEIARQLNAPDAVALEPTLMNAAVIAEDAAAVVADSATEDPRP